LSRIGRPFVIALFILLFAVACGGGENVPKSDVVSAIPWKGSENLSYVVKDKNGRRNRYQVETQLPLPESIGRERTIGEVLGLLVDADARRRPRQPTKERHAP